MEIKKHHIVYAARKSLGIGAVLFVGMALIAKIQGATLIAYFRAIIPIALITIGYFAYWIWRTQRDLPRGENSVANRDR